MHYTLSVADELWWLVCLDLQHKLCMADSGGCCAALREQTPDGRQRTDEPVLEVLHRSDSFLFTFHKNFVNKKNTCYNLEVRTYFLVLFLNGIIVNYKTLNRENTIYPDT